MTGREDEVIDRLRAANDSPWTSTKACGVTPCGTFVGEGREHLSDFDRKYSALTADDGTRSCRGTTFAARTMLTSCCSGSARKTRVSTTPVGRRHQPL